MLTSRWKARCSRLHRLPPPTEELRAGKITADSYHEIEEALGSLHRSLHVRATASTMGR